jgi:hypothetical protein
MAREYLMYWLKVLCDEGIIDKTTKIIIKKTTSIEYREKFTLKHSIRRRYDRDIYFLFRAARYIYKYLASIGFIIPSFKIYIYDI